ncbi:Hypothetical_protein [Hexamita inflata]|uniref:Hypothetical_protein n=1 Tax=Hexamita inflata TaxID=28002 RepID=A0ABP1GYF0_9EUKA
MSIISCKSHITSLKIGFVYHLLQELRQNAQSLFRSIVLAFINEELAAADRESWIPGWRLWLRECFLTGQLRSFEPLLEFRSPLVVVIEALYLEYVRFRWGRYNLKLEPKSGKSPKKVWTSSSDHLVLCAYCFVRGCSIFIYWSVQMSIVADIPAERVSL